MEVPRSEIYTVIGKPLDSKFRFIFIFIILFIIFVIILVFLILTEYIQIKDPINN